MTRVALVDDHPLFTTSLAIALRAEGLVVDVPSLSTTRALLGALIAGQPDAVVLDRDLGSFGNGEDLIDPLAAAGVRVVITSASLDEVTAGRCLSYGAVACVAKSDTFELALTTILTVAQGGNPLPDIERDRLVEGWHRARTQLAAATASFTSLTRREAWVLGQIMAGHSVRALTEESYVSEATIRTHVHKILTKLGVRSQAEAIALASRTGWRPPAP